MSLDGRQISPQMLLEGQGPCWRRRASLVVSFYARQLSAQTLLAGGSLDAAKNFGGNGTFSWDGKRILPQTLLERGSLVVAGKLSGDDRFPSDASVTCALSAFTSAVRTWLK